jgi:hypothetical protein
VGVEIGEIDNGEVCWAVGGLVGNHVGPVTGCAEKRRGDGDLVDCFYGYLGIEERGALGALGHAGGENAGVAVWDDVVRGGLGVWVRGWIEGGLTILRVWIGGDFTFDLVVTGDGVVGPPSAAYDAGFLGASAHLGVWGGRRGWGRHIW